MGKGHVMPSKLFTKSCTELIAHLFVVSQLEHRPLFSDGCKCARLHRALCIAEEAYVVKELFASLYTTNGPPLTTAFVILCPQRLFPNGFCSLKGSDQPWGTTLLLLLLLALQRTNSHTSSCFRSHLPAQARTFSTTTPLGGQEFFVEVGPSRSDSVHTRLKWYSSLFALV